MRRNDKDWVKKCMEIIVEGRRRPVGRPRKTWVENVERAMAELEIDRKDVHDMIQIKFLTAHSMQNKSVI